MELLTKSDQALLIEIARNNCQIRSDGQTTFNCKFYESIGKLKELGLVYSSCDSKDKRVKTYRLKDCGKLLAMVLLGNESKKDYMVFFLSSNIFEIDYHAVKKTRPQQLSNCRQPQEL